MGTKELAEALHEAAVWADTFAYWMEESARGPNDDADPSARTITFDADMLDQFLTGLRRLAPALERVSVGVAMQPKLPKLQLVRGGKP